MTQWFRGELEGHYVGTAMGGPAVSQYGSAERYKIRIYRALVRKIEVLESKGDPPAPTPESSEAGEDNPTGAVPPELPVELPDECFYQAKIEDTRLIGIRPRTCFEGTIYDVAVSGLRVTHSTVKGEKTYGRVVGEVYGRYLLPPDADPEAEAEVAAELRATSESHEPGSEEAIAALGAAERAEAAAEAEAEAEAEGMDALHPPSEPELSEAATHVPVPLLAIVVAIVLGLFGGWQPLAIWLGLLVPILVVRFILGSQFKVTAGQQVFGAVLVVAQLACLGVLVLDWWTAGCFSLNPWAVAGVGITALVASVLPSPFPMLATGAGMAIVLFLWSGDVATTCESLEVAPKVEPAHGPPSVHNPGKPRTNSDGSWPRRR